jgi:DNA-binding HxlR family transcriptional regulator
MVGKRSYEDGCAAAHALDLLGERWALLVVRELLLGAKRFTDLRAGLPGISPNVLTQRLTELEAAAVVQRRRLPPPAAAAVYELTPWGRELEPIILALGRWGARSPVRQPGAPLGVDSLVLSWRTMFDGQSAADFNARVELHIATQVYHAAVKNGQFSIARGPDQHADAVLEGEVATFVALVYEGARFNVALREGSLAVSGDKQVAKRFLALFPLPQVATPA